MPDTWAINTFIVCAGIAVAFIGYGIAGYLHNKE